MITEETLATIKTQIECYDADGQEVGITDIEIKYYYQEEFEFGFFLVRVIVPFIQYRVENDYGMNQDVMQDIIKQLIIEKQEPVSVVFEPRCFKTWI